MAKSPGVDHKLGIYAFLSEIHNLTHLGKLFYAGGVVGTLADGGTADVVILTGANELHLDWEVEVGGNCFMYGLEGVVAPTSGGVILGTAITSFNKYREKSAVPFSSFWMVASLVSTGTTLLKKFIPGGEKAFAGGGAAAGRDEWILNPNTYYALRIQNICGTATPVGAALEYYELAD